MSEREVRLQFTDALKSLPYDIAQAFYGKRAFHGRIFALNFTEVSGILHKIDGFMGSI